MPEEGQKKEITISFTRDKMVNIVLGVIVVLLLVFGWQLVGIKKSLGEGGKVAANTGNVAAADTTNPAAPVYEDVPQPSKQDHVLGSSDAKITLIEYSDFECPYCKQFHATAQQAVDEYAGQVNWIYRHFPLSFHPTANAKALAVECAFEQKGNEAFWAVGNAFFTGSQSLDFTTFQPQIEQAGVNFAKLQDCVDSAKYQSVVDSQQGLGSNAGVTGTPGTFVYSNETGESTLLPGAVPYSQVKAAIDRMLVASK